ncbi:XdhC family protein [Lentiprolixibacter aurantiacus]|uniref:XdhC family protein n=1 Tax=Lentiprolixibacter aurantiacus TaxID=2993939 RepID=A0AAE3MKQ6_9FLAO|nr:XdhC/CoxI family protein [Lentiprolixibacter aurantiacus]MCX2719605.1 XdhC family protein [Lentiprolixibacter aurantiacus]
MTHELKRIVKAFEEANGNKKKTVLATVVHVDGSSYRKPGVQMLIEEDGTMTGAVSGGCVEKEVNRQAQEVFLTGIPKIMTYDGRYRLGCEGILYILIEPFMPDDIWIGEFWKTISERKSMGFNCYYQLKEGTHHSYGSTLRFPFGDRELRPGFAVSESLEHFEFALKPCFKLLIVGTEHDAVKLCAFASLMGWEVTVVAAPSEQKSVRDFQGAGQFLNTVPEEFKTDAIDSETAVILMTHNFAKDLAYLLALKDTKPAYLGLLGPANRREKLMEALIERYPEVSESYLDRICGPAGLNIGSETPEEISVSILSEILAVVRKKDPILLKNKKGTIHS